jgi:hypothetical protein
MQLEYKKYFNNSKGKKHAVLFVQGKNELQKSHLYHLSKNDTNTSTKNKV